MIKESSWMVGIYRNRCFPNAELKIFMTASATIRAKKALADELIEKGNVVTLKVLKNVEEIILILIDNSIGTGGRRY
jgi:hypothetical protein